ncbi:MAG: hypothetical protein INR66_00105 [Gordonia polyisoprenivorans]|nr:hypothetical protein [Gordonia polyisoprenivorans]
MSTQNVGARMYRPVTQPRSGGMFGFTKSTTYIGLFLLMVILASWLIPPPIPYIVTAVAVVVFAPLGYGRNGKSGWEITTMKWKAAGGRRRKENLYRSGTFSRIPGRSRLPGLLAASTMYEETSAGGARFGLIHLPRKNHYTVVIRVTPRGQEWIDQATFDGRISHWGEAIASIGSATDIAGICAVIETMPETGQRVAGEVIRRRAEGCSELAAQIMQEAGDGELAQATVRTDARVAITFRATTAMRRRSAAEMAADIARRLPGILALLGRADLDPTPMTAAEIGIVVKRAYSPESLRVGERSRTLIRRGDQDAADALVWSACGPVSHNARSDVYDHDGATSITWEMSAAPRHWVQGNAMQGLLLPDPQVPWKRVAFLYRPHSAAEAVKMVDTDATDAMMEASSGKGRRSAAASLKVGLTEEARFEQAQGAGVTRVGVLITATTVRGGDLPSLDTLIKDAADSCRIDVRRCYDWQDSAFAGALGIGVILPEHASVSNGLAG